MKTRSFSLFAFVVLVACFAAGAAERLPLSIAVFDFESRDPANKDLGKQIANLVTVHLSVDPNLITVERAELAKILGEQELGLSGTVSAASAAKVGQLTGAKVLVTGRAFTVDKEQIYVAKIMSTETGRVFGELAKGAMATPVTELAEQLAKKISATVDAKGESLVAKVQTREDRVTALKAGIKATKLPVVSVKVPEVHFGSPTVDPAAQTELMLILKQTGFELVDDQSKSVADIEITGEAFSEAGVRHGNLISCKARVEIKVRERSSGKILIAERQVSVAVDLSEQIAAKSALANAAAELAMRVVPQLAK